MNTYAALAFVSPEYFMKNHARANLNEPTWKLKEESSPHCGAVAATRLKNSEERIGDSAES